MRGWSGGHSSNEVEIMFPRNDIVTDNIGSVAASANASTFFYFPRPVRIKRYAAVPSAAQASHASQESKVEFINRGADGSGSAVLATLTNLSGATASSTLVKGGWAAGDALELNAEDRSHNGLTPTAAQNSADSLPAGTVVEARNTKAAGTATSNVVAVLEFTEST
jgi:hypothetical protein